MDIIMAIERLNEIRNLKRELEREEERLRQLLVSVVEAAGGKLVVGSYVLSLSTAETCQYSKIVSLLKARHPELESELSELSERFKTVYTRLKIEQF